MKLTDLLYEIGDASAKPFNWSVNRSIDLVSKQFIVGIDKRTNSRDWIGPIKFGYTAHSNKAQYDITIEAMGRKRMVLRLPGTPKPKQSGIKELLLRCSRLRRVTAEVQQQIGSGFGLRIKSGYRA